MATTGPGREGFPATAPKFFKIIWDPQADSLRIPAVFRQRYGDSLPKSVFLKVPSGSSLEVELTQSNGETWLQKGWQEFKERYSIGFGHLLVFQYNGNSQFDVLIFDTTAVEIEYPFDTNHDGGKGHKRASDQMPDIVGSGTGSDDSVVFLGETATSKNGVGRGETQKDSDRTESDVCMEILNNTPPRQQDRSKSRHCDGYHSGHVPNCSMKLDRSNSDLDFQNLKPKLKKECRDGGSQYSDRLQS
ncbi:hypothetical protein CDL12_15057 [Handroanthus impetiginosus]|uniref:TF-B3 domain-containing protein n=1 Tax=Handroanthus impetiginosus TaxID=429701 RepID=A0A2G9H483_9LAMI|nr:hypothetical protein CDL12_15057 [Handroanthus impetiginosus]